MAQPFVIFKGQVEPVATYPLTVKGAAFPLTNCTVTFSMRLATSNVPSISHATAIISGDPLAGIVEYDWASGDTNVAGTYIGWFTVTLPNGKPQDTPEFEIEVTDHVTVGTAALVTLQEQIDAMRLGNMLRPVLENDYQFIRALILAASQVCEVYTSHRFAPETAVSKDFSYGGDMVLDLSPFDLRTATSVSIDTDISGFLLDPTMYRFEPRNRPYGIYTHMETDPNPIGGIGRSVNFWGGGSGSLSQLGGWYQFGRQVTILGDWGWTTIPEPIKQGVKVLVTRWFQNPAGAQIIRVGQTEWEFNRGSAGGGGGTASIGDDLPSEVTSMWKPFVRPGNG